jgi:hypothetical protein
VTERLLKWRKDSVMTDTVQLHLAGLDPSDNLEIQRSLRDLRLTREAGVTMSVDNKTAGGQYYGEPGTLALVFEVVRSVAPTVLGLLSIWLEWRRKRTAAEKSKPVQLTLTLPSGEKLSVAVDSSSDSSSSSATEMLLKAAETLAAGAAK